MSCDPNVKSITLLEPDDTVLSTTSLGSQDASLQESGFIELAQGVGQASVNFVVPKASDNYRFEYLYVDAFGITNPGVINPVPVTQTIYGFAIDLGGEPPVTGYILRWRVVVVDLSLTPSDIDAPESLRVQLLANALSQVIFFVNPRSGTTYGFSELRVENLIDAADSQSPILAQVCEKLIGSFKVALSPRPPNNNYFLVARTP